MTEHEYLIFIAPVVITILAIFGFKYGAAAYQARARGAAEAAYRELAQNAVTSQAETNARLAALQGDIALLSKSLAAVVKILQDVG